MRYVNYTSHSQNWTNCYVCSHMPYSTDHSGIRARGLTSNMTRCLLGLAMHPGVGSRLSRADYTVPLNVTTPTVDSNCSTLTDVLTWPQLADPRLSHPNTGHGYHFPICVAGNGTRQVGNLSLASCNLTYTYCRYKDEAAYVACAAKDSCRSNQPMFDLLSKMRAVDSAWCRLSHNCQCSDFASSKLGSRVLADYHFLCGQNVYANLPLQ